MAKYWTVHHEANCADRVFSHITSTLVTNYNGWDYILNMLVTLKVYTSQIQHQPQTQKSMSVANAHLGYKAIEAVDMSTCTAWTALSGGDSSQNVFSTTCYQKMKCSGCLMLTNVSWVAKLIYDRYNHVPFNCTTIGCQSHLSAWDWVCR